ncbi:putative phage abortive infection protein [Paenibacillus sp. Y412MC10]|uniref:putative phage abortive infection protein n=1 Tax=Geobacillus sp. (strain Y412MC10) TaxID=481743 RepID=UPI0011A948A2|nr:putative phage abortive infection protein [Paenibacillus sp. Y412MC10]
MSRIRSYYYDERAEELKLTRVFLSIVSLWALSGLVLFFLPNRGEFGDMFGAINTLFSGLAFGGIIYTIFQQKVELKLQRQELKLQRQEVERTNQELAKQVEAINIQRFESTFFNMITLHHQLVDGLVFKHDQSDTIYSTGRAVFESLYNEIRRKDSGRIHQHLDDLFRIRELSLAQYFNNLIEILNLVERTELLDDEQKWVYFKTLSAQLSPAEGTIIFYYIFWNEHGGKYDNLHKLVAEQAHFLPNKHMSLWIDWIEDYKNRMAMS